MLNAVKKPTKQKAERPANSSRKTQQAIIPAQVIPMGVERVGDQPSPWKFNIGTMVSHRDQHMPSLVVDRVRTSKGREIYGIRSFAWNDERRDRMILGEFLVAMDDRHPAWARCLLADTPLDPRLAA